MLRTDGLIVRAAAVAAGALMLAACSSAGSEYIDAGSGGQVGTGGASATGPGTGGVSSTGGTQPGVVVASSGGVTGTGSVDATGNAPATGTGGDTGQPQGTGGTPVATGGASTGGVPSTGGQVATGGVPSTGGQIATGGSPATGGAAGCDSGPLTTSLPDCQVVPLPTTGDYHQDCVNEINQFRWLCQCLPPLERWTEGEACADQMAQYDYENGSAHGGFMAGICDPSGSGQCECPGWGSVESITQGTSRMESCLAMMWHEVDNPDGEQGHYEAMSSDGYTAVACGIYEGSDGEVWAVQNYTR